jgi:hypothetical protein
MGCKIRLISGIFSLLAPAAAFAAANSDADTSAVSSARINETLAIAREATYLAGVGVADAAAKLPQLIKEDYGLEVGCDDGFFSGLSAPACLLGLRAFARALYRSYLPKLNRVSAAVLKVVMVSSRSVQVRYEEESMEIDLPYTSTPEEIYMLVTPLLQSEGFLKRVFVRTQFENTLANLKANLDLDLTFDPNLSLAEKWTAVNTLISLAKEDLSLFERDADSLHVVRWGFAALHERGLRLEETISAHAGPGQVRSFLVESGRSGAALARSTGALRGRIAILKDRAARRWKADIECSSAGDLTLARCLLALRKINKITLSEPDLRPGAAMILVTGDDEMSDSFDVFSLDGDLKTIFAVREDFTLPDFMSYAKTKGWSP